MNKKIKKLWWKIKYSNFITFFTGGIFKHPYPIFYRIKCFIFRPYTTIKPRNLRHTWCDTTELIPHMLFELLERFLVDEMNLSLETYTYINPPIVISGKEVNSCNVIDINGKKKNAYYEMARLLKWWHTEYIAVWNNQHPIQNKLIAEFEKYGDPRNFVDQWISKEDEKGRKFVQWENKPADKKRYDKAHKAWMKFDEKMSEDLIENMKILVSLHQFM